MGVSNERSLPPVPDCTARVARVPVREGSFFRTVGDQLPTLLADLDFPASPGAPLSRPLLALVTAFQYMEGLSDAEAADAVRRRIDWKYAMHLPLAFAGFDQTVLGEFRESTVADPDALQAFERLLMRLRDLGFGRHSRPAGAEQVVNSLRMLNRLLLIKQAMCLALQALRAAQPTWVRGVSRPHWEDAYGRASTVRPPAETDRREALALSIAVDAQELIRRLDEGPAALAQLPEVELLRRVWRLHFEARDGQVRWRSRGADAPGAGSRRGPSAGEMREAM